MSALSAAEKLDRSLDDIIKTSAASNRSYGRFQQPRPQRAGPYGGGERKQGVRLFVGNLAYEVKWQDLKDKMATVGDVIRADVIQGPDGRSKGCGIVEFANREAADAAIATLNGAELLGRPITVREDREAGRSFPPIGQAPRPNYEAKRADDLARQAAEAFRARVPAECQVYVGNLPFSTTWQNLKDLCAPFGTVLRADIFEDRATGRSKGRGLVIFETSSQAQECISRLNDTSYQGRLLSVHHDAVAMKHNPEPGARLYVSNLAWAATWQDLKDLFSPYGNVLRADVALEKGTGRSKGYGTVTFGTKVEAELAMQSLNNVDLHGRPLHIREDHLASPASVV